MCFSADDDSDTCSGALELRMHLWEYVLLARRCAGRIGDNKRNKRQYEPTKLHQHSHGRVRQVGDLQD